MYDSSCNPLFLGLILFYFFIIYFLALKHALEMHLNRNIKQKSENEAEKLRITRTAGRRKSKIWDYYRVKTRIWFTQIVD